MPPGCGSIQVFIRATRRSLRLAPARRQRDVDDQPAGLPAPFDRAAEVVLDAALHEQRAETGAVGGDDRAIAAAFGPGQAEPAIVAALGLLRPAYLDAAVRTGERAMLRGIGREFIEEERHRDQRVFGKQRSEEHTSELQSLMRISYAVF